MRNHKHIISFIPTSQTCDKEVNYNILKVKEGLIAVLSAILTLPYHLPYSNLDQGQQVDCCQNKWAG